MAWKTLQTHFGNLKKSLVYCYGTLISSLACLQCVHVFIRSIHLHEKSPKSFLTSLVLILLNKESWNLGDGQRKQEYFFYNNSSIVFWNAPRWKSLCYLRSALSINTNSRSYNCDRIQKLPPMLIASTIYQQQL